MGILVHYKNNSPSVKINMDPMPFCIGRGDMNELSLDDDLASREHAIVEKVTGEQSGSTEYVLRDCSSTNGTFVNGERVSAHLLVEGDTIRIGRTFFRFFKNAQGELNETVIMKRILPGIFYTTPKK
ncbi:FHA domain-containing protein [Thiohalomonas denitrificans]|uniref:FHA domain-containing protein n=1 Tax=Thiohalomonas denitrificans TaxID=415747 RepID=UPI0026F2FCF5|nr:FHA domain-containing protein [Thiohalomonas denitrificans]